jgi:hypothetical protein
VNRWASHNPEAYERGEGPPDPRDAWDMERKRQKEEGPLNQVAPDRVVLTHDDREMCPVCSEYPITEGIYCRRCARSIEEDRLERERGG